ncbi:hypothetical protein [Carnobacterium maltaromaticum]|uniref:hypothetical protein n=1 Tax=Carnobacterium maltaromaticum TaxID=2751 RepID=UPI0039AF2A2E
MKKLFKSLFVLILFTGSFLAFGLSANADEPEILNPGEIKILESETPLNDNQIQEKYGEFLDGDIYQEVILPIYPNSNNSPMSRLSIGTIKFYYQSGSVHWNISGIVSMNGNITFTDLTSGSSYKVGVRGTYGSNGAPTAKGHKIRATLDAKITDPKGNVGWIPSSPWLQWTN